MGYETKGNGWAVIKKEMIDAAKTVLKSGKFNIHYEFWTDTYHTHQREMLDLEQKGVYDESNVMAFLNAIKPFVEEGMFKFSGEEGEYWRFKYDPKTGEWEEQSTTEECSRAESPAISFELPPKKDKNNMET